MPNIAALLKSEISRVARKELKPVVDSLKKLAASQRAEIASLKRRVQDLERQAKASTRGESRRAAKAVPADEGDEVGGELRFRAAGMANNRKRLGLSASDFGLLVGASGQSVYAWEQGKAKPRARHLASIAELRGIGKREVEARLAALRTGS